MIDVLLDTLLDIVKLLPFLFISFLILELLEHKLSTKSKRVITSSGKFGPLIGALLGGIPQCGFSVVATNFYVTRVITLGTLIAIYLSTSDEMLPILLANQVSIIEIVKIVGLKVVIGMVVGFIIDFITHSTIKEDFNICEDDHCDCDHSLIKSAIIHTLKTLLFIGIATFILNITFYFISEDAIKRLFLSNYVIGSFLSPLLGLIPNCAASVILTELYLNGVLTLGTTIGGLLTGSGVAILILFKNNKNVKENLKIVGIIYAIGVISGLILNIIGI